MPSHLAMKLITIFIIVLQCVSLVSADYTCSATAPCSNGACCSLSGYCGYGPTYCGAQNCTSNCNAHSECGQYSDPPNIECPLNVCCSEFGFCGTTDDFCTTASKCQSNCGNPTRPSCPNGASAFNRLIGYYESWAVTRSCNTYPPEYLHAEDFTHLNFAFALIDSSYNIVPMSSGDPGLYVRFTALKSRNSGLKTFISIGGWSFNDPPTQSIFTSMAADPNNRATFIKSAISFMTQYGFDGADLDWEYPVAPERGGQPQDYDNYVTLLSEMKSAFGSKFGLTITAPASYWYLQNFNLEKIADIVDWVNVMTYDIHGIWDATSVWLGPYIHAHTNLTEIQQALDLFWRSQFPSDKLVMGLGFYGRSFTLASPACSSTGCAFSGPGSAGNCTNSAGTLSFAEISQINATTTTSITLDPVAAVQMMVYNDGTEWVSFDDPTTLNLKINFANNQCLGGLMIWAADTDAMNGELIEYITDQLPPGLLTKRINSLSDSGASAVQCYWTDCQSKTACNSGDVIETTGHTGDFSSSCGKGYRTYCCPPKAAFDNTKCSWKGTAPFCNGQCGGDGIEIARDNTGDGHVCWTGSKTYCCDPSISNSPDAMIHACKWIGSAPFCGNTGCPSDYPYKLTRSVSGGGGQWCDFPLFARKSLCCPSANTLTGCAWTSCGQTCPTGKVEVSTDPLGDTYYSCVSVYRSFCCDPPTSNVEQCPANPPDNDFGLNDPSSLGRRELPDFGLSNELTKRAKRDNLFPVTQYALLAQLVAWIYQQLVGENWYAQSPSLFNQIGGNLQNPDGAVIIGPTNNQYQGSELIWRFRAMMRLALVARAANNANYVQQFLSNNLGTDTSIARQYPQSLQQLLIANQNNIPTTQTWAYGTTGNVGNPTPYPNINLPVDSRLRYTQGGHVGPIGYEAALLLAFQVAGVNFAGTIDDMFHVIQAPQPQVRRGYFPQGCLLQNNAVNCMCVGDGGSSTSNSIGAGVYHAFRFQGEQNYLVIGIHTMDARSVVALQNQNPFVGPQYGATPAASSLSGNNLYPAPANTNNARLLAHLHVGVWTPAEAALARGGGDLPNYHQIGAFHFYINPEMNSDDYRQGFLNNPDKPSTEGGGHDEL